MGIVKFFWFLTISVLLISSIQSSTLGNHSDADEDSGNHLMSVINSSEPDIFVDTGNCQGTTVLIQVHELFNVEPLLNWQLLLLGTHTSNDQKCGTKQKDVPTKRMVIKETIERNPGIRLREVYRTTRFSMGVTQYHISCLEAEEIESIELGKCKHFFVQEADFSENEKTWLSIVRNPNVKKILQSLGSDKNHYYQKDIVKMTGISKGMVSYYVKQLKQFGIIDDGYNQLIIQYKYLAMKNSDYWKNR
jgi:hypothetical protein